MRVALLALVLASCSGNLSRGECNRLADRMIDIFTAPSVEDPPKDLAAAVDQWREKLKGDNQTKEHLVDVCLKAMTSRHASCVEEAKDEKALANCFGG